MARIVYSAGATLKGATEADDIQVSFTSVVRSVPYSADPPVYVPGCVVYPSTPAQTVSDGAFTFSGNTKGAYLKLVDSDRWRVVGNDVREVYRGNNNRFYFEFGNNFYRRRGSSDVATSSTYRGASQPGLYDYNSLAASSTRLVRSRFQTRQPGADTQCLFLDGGSYAVEAPSVTPNPNCALADMDWSGVSVTSTNGSGLAFYPVMLVSPRHAVCNKHIGAYTGQEVVFRRRDGSYQTVNVLGEVDSATSDDLRVVVFDADVTDCAYYKTLPADWRRYIPALTSETLGAYGGVGCVPLVFRTYNTGIDPSPDTPPHKNNPIASSSPKLRVDWLALMDSPIKSGPTVPPGEGLGAGMILFPTDALHGFFNNPYPGDSGSPGFFLVPSGPNSQSFTPALVTSYWTPRSGPCYTERRAWIDTTMQALSTTYGVQGTYTFGTLDLSAYPTYD